MSRPGGNWPSLLSRSAKRASGCLRPSLAGSASAISVDWAKLAGRITRLAEPKCAAPSSEFLSHLSGCRRAEKSSCRRSALTLQCARNSSEYSRSCLRDERSSQRGGLRLATLNGRGSPAFWRSFRGLEQPISGSQRISRFGRRRLVRLATSGVQKRHSLFSWLAHNSKDGFKEPVWADGA